jgi:hypothetical protein
MLPGDVILFSNHTWHHEGNTTGNHKFAYATVYKSVDTQTENELR